MEIVMTAAGILFAVLFSFLAFVFLVYAASLFVKRGFPEFEPGVSIVIPAYNEERNIRACLDSLAAGSYPKEKTEIIVVDDGSTDGTREVAKSYQGVRLLEQGHKGKSEALTLGAKAAKHSFVIGLDADTTVERDCVKELVKPLSDSRIGATTAVSKVKNSGSLLGIFQNIEYHYNNLIRYSFSRVFNNGIWFFGAMACYRKSALEKAGYFKTDTLTEDMDIALEIKRLGYRTYCMKSAVAETIVPASLAGFYRQRSRWWQGVLQALVKNRQLLSLKTSPSILFLFVNQFWWSFYAFLSLPLIIYQVNYWLPYNSETAATTAAYLFRWFSLSGPFYVLYKIPEWGVSLYSFFGVLSGLVSAFLIVMAIRLFRDRLHLKNAIAVFFYFPYTIMLNMVIFISVLKLRGLNRTFYLKE